MLIRELQSKTLRVRKAIAAKFNRFAGDRDLRGRRLPEIGELGERGNKLGVVAIVKNERSYIGEWLQFQFLQGASHVYIYDNGSTDDTVDVALRYAGSNVTVVPWQTFAIADEHKFSIQSLAYGHALCNFGPRLRWMAFIDVDEFLFSPTGAVLPAVLEKLDHLPSIAVPWTNFGPNGHLTKPSGLVIDNYTECAPHPLLPSQRSLLRYKSIVDPLQISAMASHLFPVRNHGVVAINERGEMIPTYKTTDNRFVATDLLQLNHYFTRSAEEIQERIAKGRVSQNGRVNENYLERRLTAYSQRIIRDETIRQFSADLRRRLKKIEQTA